MKREPHWVKLFLRELERTGNVRLAAEGAGVDFTSAYQRRKRHAEFAERWAAALAAHAARCADGGGAGERALATIPTPGKGPPPSAGIPPARSRRRSLEAGSERYGEDLNVRPDGKVIKGSRARWGKRAEERFLTELTVSANVKRAAKEAGFSTTAIYRQRLKSRRLAAAWDAALETGRAHLQAHLVQVANQTFDPDELTIGERPETPKVSVAEAISIAKLGASAGQGRAAKAGLDQDGDGRFVTNQEMDEARERILNRLQRMQENIEGQEASTGRCHHCGQPLPAEGVPESQLPRARFL